MERKESEGVREGQGSDRRQLSISSTDYRMHVLQRLSIFISDYEYMYAIGTS